MVAKIGLQYAMRSNFSLPKSEPHPSRWEAGIPGKLKAWFQAFTAAFPSLTGYLELRSASAPYLLMNPIPANKALYLLILYFDLMIILEKEIRSIPNPEELPHLCEELENEWIKGGKTIEPFAEESCDYRVLFPLPTDIYAESIGEAHALLSAIHNFNKEPAKEKAASIITKCLQFRTIDSKDKTRLLCCLIQRPSLHLHLLLKDQMGVLHKLSSVTEAPEEKTADLQEVEHRKAEMLKLLVNSENHPPSHFPKVLFEPLKPALSLKKGHFPSYQTVGLNIFSGKVTAHTDLIQWKKQKAPSLYSITEMIWRQLQNGSLELKIDRETALAQLSSDLRALFIAFGADRDLNFQKMDPHLFTVKGIELYVRDKFQDIEGVEPAFLASVISQNLLALISQSRPITPQVLGIGADHDGSVTHCHNGNALFYQIHLDKIATQKEFENRVFRYSHFLQGPLQSTMNASTAIKPEATAALLYGGDLNLSFGKAQLEQIVYNTMAAEVLSDLLPHSLDIFSHRPSGKHKQYSKVIADGEERLLESERGCYDKKGEPLPYVIYPGTIYPVPFKSPTSAGCESLGNSTTPFNPMDHRAFQYGTYSGNPAWASEPFESRIYKNSGGQGQTIFFNGMQYELKGFIPNNLAKIVLSTNHSCSSFVFMMLHAAYFATHLKGFDEDMDAVRTQFLPKTPFDGYLPDASKAYHETRMEFQKHAVDLIEAIWYESMAEPGLAAKFEEEVLPSLIRSKKGKRLTRPELCRIRTLSQLHCLQSDQKIVKLGRLINWFFPEPTRKTAVEMKEFLEAACHKLKSHTRYQEALKEVKNKFDISPMQTSPGLLLDKFEREKMQLPPFLPVFPFHMARISKIFRKSLETSYYDPFGYRTDPSQVRARVIDAGPKFLGKVRRFIQAGFSLVHEPVRLLMPKANNQHILKDAITLVSPKKICMAAPAPHPNKRSIKVEEFENTTFSWLCDLIDEKKTASDCYSYFQKQLELDAYPVIASVVALKLDRLGEWRKDLEREFSSSEAMKQALTHIQFRQATEKSLQEGVAKTKASVKAERTQLAFFETHIYRTMDLLREIMLELKTVFLEINADLCDDAGEQESARNRTYEQEKKFLLSIQGHSLWSFHEWKEECQAPDILQEDYETFHNCFVNAKNALQSEIAIKEMSGALSKLLNNTRINVNSLDPIEVLDYPLFHSFLLILDHLVLYSTEEAGAKLNDLVDGSWLDDLFLLPAHEFMQFLEFLKGEGFGKKISILKEALSLKETLKQKEPESLHVINYFQI